MYERNEQRGNVKLHQQGILYVQIQRRSFNFKNFTWNVHTAVVVVRVCLCFVLSVTPVGRWLSTWAMANMRTRCQALHNRRTQSPPSPPSQLPFSLCAAFVLSSLICVGIYHGKGGHKKPRSCLKEESFTIIYINKKRLFTITITSDNGIYPPRSFPATNKRTEIRARPFCGAKCAAPVIRRPSARRVLDNEKMLISSSIQSVLRRLIHIIQHCGDHNDGLLLLI